MIAGLAYEDYLSFMILLSYESFNTFEGAQDYAPYRSATVPLSVASPAFLEHVPLLVVGDEQR